MTQRNPLDQLRAETQLAQEQHKLQRLENRKQYYEKGERRGRTHRLCNLGGTPPSLAPEVKDHVSVKKHPHDFLLMRMLNCFTDTGHRQLFSWNERQIVRLSYFAAFPFSRGLYQPTCSTTAAAGSATLVGMVEVIASPESATAFFSMT